MKRNENFLFASLKPVIMYNVRTRRNVQIMITKRSTGIVEPYTILIESTVILQKTFFYTHKAVTSYSNLVL
jgi:hypothetical protein